MATPTTSTAPAPAPSNASTASTAARKKAPYIRIKDLTPALCDKECSLKAIVMESNAKDDANTSTNATLLIGDETGCVSLVVQKSIACHLRLGDIIQLMQTQVVMKNNTNRMYLWGGRVERTGEFTMLFKEAYNVSNITWVKDPKNPENMIPGRNPLKRPKYPKAP